MTLFQPIAVPADRVMAALIAGLELEFGKHAAEGLAQHFLDAEECDLHWDARIEERWIGSYAGGDDADLELDRIAVLGRIDGAWFVAVCIVDGEGRAHGMIGRRCFATLSAARSALAVQR